MIEPLQPSAAIQIPRVYFWGSLPNRQPPSSTSRSTGPGTSTTYAVRSKWANTAAGGPSRTSCPRPRTSFGWPTPPTRPGILYTSIGRTIAGIDLSARGDVQPRLTADGGILRIGSAGGAYDSVIHDLQLLSGSVLTGSADYVLTGQPSCRTTPYSTAPVRRRSRPAVTPSQTASSWTTADGSWCRSLTHNGCYDYLYSATAR